MLVFLAFTVTYHWRELFLSSDIVAGESDSALGPVARVVTLLALANFVAPVLLSALHGLAQLRWMVRSVVPFLAFLPTFITGLALYAVARTWDLTWGNRPSDAVESMERRVAARAEQEVRAAQKNRSRELLAFVLLANALLFFAGLILDGNPWLTLALAALVFGGALLQMAMSAVVLLAYRVRSAGRSLRRCLCAERWTLSGHLRAEARLSEREAAAFALAERAPARPPPALC